MKQGFAWALVMVGLGVIIGCGGGGGGGGTDGSTDGTTPDPVTDLRIGATSGTTYVDAGNIEVGETLDLKVYGRRQNGSITTVTATNWTTTAPSSVAVLESDGTITGVSASANSYTVSANATGTTVTSTLMVKPAQARVTGNVTTMADAAIPGATVRFYTEAGVEVGRAITGHNGTFMASVPTTATRFSLDISATSSYHRQFDFASKSYVTELESCRAPLPALANGQTKALGSAIKLYLRSSGPPPAPSGCLD